MKKDITYIHIVRVVACIMVVFLHSLPAFNEFTVTGLDSLFRTGIMIVTSPCVPLFFMITGILILPIKTNTNTFYKKRILRVLYPLFIWGGIYALLPYFLGMQTFTMTLKELLLSPLVCPSKIGGILWYLYMLIGIYLILPFFSSKLYTDKNYQKLYLIIWLSSSLVWLIQMFEPRILGINLYEHNVHALSYFWGYLGFCILGLYTNVNKCKIGGGKTIFNYLVTCIFIFVGSRYSGSNLSLWIGSFLSIPSIILTVTLFMYIKGLKIKEESRLYKLIKNISSLSFGIYLSHMVVYRCLTINLYYLSTSWIQQISVFILTFMGGWLLSYMLSKLPLSKYIIGV